MKSLMAQWPKYVHCSLTTNVIYLNGNEAMIVLFQNDYSTILRMAAIFFYSAVSKRLPPAH